MRRNPSQMPNWQLSRRQSETYFRQVYTVSVDLKDKAGSTEAALENNPPRLPNQNSAAKVSALNLWFEIGVNTLRDMPDLR